MGVTVAVQITGDAASATAAIQLVSGKLGELANDQNKVNSSGKQGASGVDALSGAIGKLGGFIAAAQTASFVADLYAIGAASQVARGGLEAMVGTGADSYIEAVQGAVRGTVSDMDAANIANRAVAFGFASTAEEAGEFTRVATVLGKTFRGLGAAAAAEELGLLLNNMSVLRLDTFGISGAKVKSRMEELQNGAQQLSREAAFKQAFWEEAVPAADRYADVLESNSAKMDRLTASVDNLKAGIGEWVADGLAPATEGANNLVSGINSVNEVVKQQRTHLMDTTTTFDEFIEKALTVPFLQQEIGDALHRLNGGKLDALRAEWESHRAAVLASASAMSGSADRAAELQARQSALATDIDATAAATTSLVADLEAYSTALERNADFQRNILSNINELTTAKGGLATIYDYASAAVDRYDVTAQQALVMTQELGLATGQLTQKQIEQTTAISELTNLWGEGRIGAEQFAQSMTAIQQGADAAKVSTDAQVAATNALYNTLISQGIPSMEAWAQAHKQVQADAAGTPETIDSLRGKVDELNAIVANMTQPEKITFTSTAGEEYGKVQTLIDAINLESSLTPAAITFPNNAPAATAHVETLMNKVQALDGMTATLYVNVVQSGSVPSAADLPGNQQGTPYFPGGLTVVGEEGPEVVNLPRGSRIRSNRDSRDYVDSLTEDAAGAGGDTFIITGPVYVTVPERGGIGNIMQQIATVRK